MKRLVIAAAVSLAIDHVAVEAPAQDVQADAADAAQAAWTVPRTPWGDPDLQGMWPVDHMNGTPLQRPAEFGTRRFLTNEEFAERRGRLAELNARYDDEIQSNTMGMGHWVEMGQPNRLTSLITEPADGRIPPLTDEGEKRSATMTSSWSDMPFRRVSDFNALDRCITRGLPASMFPFMYNSGIQILQAPGYVVLRLELIHETRLIALAGSERLDSDITQWLGFSRGHWDGDTLVVETANFNGAAPMIIVGPGAKPIPTSESMRIVERFTRIDDETISYAITVEDPEMLTGPWRAEFPWKLNPGYEFFEYACHEDNHIVEDMIGVTRHELENVRTD